MRPPGGGTRKCARARVMCVSGRIAGGGGVGGGPYLKHVIDASIRPPRTTFEMHNALDEYTRYRQIYEVARACKECETRLNLALFTLSETAIRVQTGRDLCRGMDSVNG